MASFPFSSTSLSTSQAPPLIWDRSVCNWIPPGSVYRSKPWYHRDKLDSALSVPTLTTLNLQRNFDTNSQRAIHLAELLRQMTSLTKLRLVKNFFTSVEVRQITEALHHNPSLTSFELVDWHINVQVVTTLEELLHLNPNLSSLVLSVENHATSGPLASLIASSFHLTSLDLSRNGFTDLDAENLARGLKQNSTLTRLDVSRNGFSDRGANEFAIALQSNSVLVYFSIYPNLIPSELPRSVERRPQSLPSPKLRFLAGNIYLEEIPKYFPTLSCSMTSAINSAIEKDPDITISNFVDSLGLKKVITELGLKDALLKMPLADPLFDSIQTVSDFSPTYQSHPFYSTVFPSEYHQWFPLDIEEKTNQAISERAPLSPFDRSNLTTNPIDCDQLCTGDLLLGLANAREVLMADFILHSTGSPVTDVAVVIRQTTGLRVFTVSDINDRFSLHPPYFEKLQVIHSFEKWIAGFRGNVFVRKLNLETEQQQKIENHAFNLQEVYAFLDPAKVPLFFNAVAVATLFFWSGVGTVDPWVVVPGHFLADLPCPTTDPPALPILHVFTPPPPLIPSDDEVLHDALIVNNQNLFNLCLREFFVSRDSGGKLILVVVVDPEVFFNENEKSSLCQKISDQLRCPHIHFTIAFETPQCNKLRENI